MEKVTFWSTGFLWASVDCWRREGCRSGKWLRPLPRSGRRPDSGSSMLDSIDSYTNPAHRARSRCLSQVGHGLVTDGLSREFVSRVLYTTFAESPTEILLYSCMCVCVCVCVCVCWTCDAPEASSRCLRGSNKCVCVSASPSPPRERLGS